MHDPFCLDRRRRRVQLELESEAYGGIEARTLHVHREPPKTRNPNRPVVSKEILTYFQDA